MRARPSMRVGLGAPCAAGAAIALVFACSSASGPSGTMLGDTPPPPNTGDASRPMGGDEGGLAPPEAGKSDADAMASSGGDGAASDGPHADSADGATGDARPGDASALDSGDAAVGVGADAGVDAAPALPVCDPTHVWAPVQRIPSVPPTNFARLGGIGAAELTVAWTTTDGSVYVADRTTRGQGFGVPVAVATASVAVDRAALSAAGLVVIAVAADRSGFVEFQRSSVGAAWAAASPLELANVNAMNVAELSAHFSEPVLSADGRSFFFVMTTQGSPPAVYESAWDNVQRAWATGLRVQELSSGDAASPTYPTGTSSDGLTLFYFDGVAGNERGAWRASVNAPFTIFVDEAMEPEAVPNFLCNTLYFQSSDTDGLGVFEAQ